MKPRINLLAAALAAVAIFGAAASADPASSSQVANVESSVNASSSGESATATSEHYLLGAGDKLRLSVFGEADLGGEFEIDGSGDVRLPLIGQVKAAGLTVRAFEDKVVSMLQDGYLKDPRISIEVVSYRPFYIIGEVNKPGQYSYVNGMNALNAIALAGGYTSRANKSDVYVQRSGKAGEEEFPSDETTRIQPGDVVRIPERFF